MSKKCQPAVVALGELVVDWIAREKSAGFIESSTFVKSLGGNASNVAIGLSRLGTPARVIARVGADVHGRYLLKVLKEEGVDVGFVRVDEEAPTAQCYVFTSADEDNTFLNWPPNNAAFRLQPADIAAGLSGASCIHATGISLTTEPRKSAVLHALDRAASLGLVVSFDAGFPTGEGSDIERAVRQAIQTAHVVKVNLSELFFWCRHFGINLSEEDHKVFALYEKPPSSGHESVVHSTPPVKRKRIEELAAALFEAVKPAILAVTLAERGSLVISAEHRSWRRSVVVDYTAGVGAGDAFMAGLIHSLFDSVERLDPNSIKCLPRSVLEHINEFASIVGALATTQISAYEGLPSRRQVDSLLSKERNRLSESR